MNNTTKTSTFKGYIVRCNDLDSMDVFHIEIMLNEDITDVDLQKQLSEAASRNDLVSLSGNAFSFENCGTSGRRVTKTTTIAYETLGEQTKSAAKLLSKISIG